MVMEAQDTAIKPGYKLTEVGVIPKDWGISTVGAEFEVQLGKMLDLEKNKGLLKNYIGNKAVQWGHIDISDLQTMAMSRSDLARFRLRCGDLLVCEGGEVGRAAIWEAPIEECYYQKALHRLRPLRGFNTHLMLALLQYWTTYGKLTDYVSQTSIAHLTRENFIEVQMPVPDADEQRAIATALSDVDALITSLDKLIAKKRNIKQATMQQLLTGKTRLPGFSKGSKQAYKQTEVGIIPEDWSVKSVGEIANVKGGKRLPPGKTLSDSPTPYPYIRITDMLSGGVSLDGIKYVPTDVFPSIKNYRIFKDDIFVTVAGTLGIIGKIPPELNGANLTENADKITNITCDKGYLFYTLVSPRIQRIIETEKTVGAQPKLALNRIENFQIALPIDKDEQQAIATVLSDMDAEITALEHKREKTHMLKQGMMQELLTGKTRLV